MCFLCEEKKVPGCGVNSLFFFSLCVIRQFFFVLRVSFKDSSGKSLFLSRVCVRQLFSLFSRCVSPREIWQKFCVTVVSSLCGEETPLVAVVT